ncbi:hypothetical protein CONLIGDRAFT_144500 [Coniochaeta ligniaria NRRL 30616]|uniref:Uncharacterized protein n=1 Tax=Coniochaeta ligniaria NRRL 30616 TaxID=1408157 RepID=A0A1J7I6D8_9PEZI|nr:hypothetical protein CONLIGDRAFT_144500 [Coniochaeta ligniaria NRRL 30616]
MQGAGRQTTRLNCVDSTNTTGLTDIHAFASATVITRCKEWYDWSMHHQAAITRSFQAESPSSSPMCCPYLDKEEGAPADVAIQTARRSIKSRPMGRPITRSSAIIYMYFVILDSELHRQPRRLYPSRTLMGTTNLAGLAGLAPLEINRTSIESLTTVPIS